MGNLVTKKCGKCGREFQTCYARRLSAKYCSNKCRLEATRPRLDNATFVTKEDHK